ncbi:MAG TPA: PIN domain-containing protein [Thermoanaerobaculia bacterium]|nr:PIN domain-containing protein [Thermoanaerobaculia bacterium]
MRVLLLDTNTLNYVLKSRQPASDRLRRAVQEGDRFLLASVVHHELTRYLELKGADRLMRLYHELVEPWIPCNLGFEDWSSAAHLWADRHRTGRSISDLDLLLATLARKHQAILVTSNARHFQDLGLILEDWTQPLEQ